MFYLYLSIQNPRGPPQLQAEHVDVSARERKRGRGEDGWICTHPQQEYTHFQINVHTHTHTHIKRRHIESSQLHLVE